VITVLLISETGRMRYSPPLPHRAPLMMATILAAGLFTAPGLAQSARQDFVLVNRTGYELSELYVSPSKSDEWGDDILNDESIPNGETANVTFRRSAKGCLWDLKVVYSDDDSSAVWRSIDLCKISRITIRYNRNTDKTSASFD
jgi:hypothetical protein